MRIYLFRHGEKEQSFVSNPGLTLRGKSQALNISKAAEQGQFQKPDRIYSSPKIRALQTLQPLAETFMLDLYPIDDLEERHSSEPASLFSQRVQNYLQWVGTQTGVIYLCTHLDWIEEALAFIPSDSDLGHEKYHVWGSAQFMEFDVQDGIWHLLQFGRIET
ncbi:MAG: hypothetical protein BroJett040_24690 [Oligoflexia bacterium]|nr:MAG: hypothetical protein BroJett040_24690 [Oligoflexia bacterium]